MFFDPKPYDIDRMADELNAYNQEPNAIPLQAEEANELMLAMLAGASEEFHEFMVLGKSEIRTDPQLIKNLGIMRESTSPLQIDKRIGETIKGIFPSAPSPAVEFYVKTLSTQGAIMNSTRWHIIKNDCFIYGALQSKKSFNLALEKLTEDDLWNNVEHRPTVLGRELYMLKLSGYKAHQTTLEMLFSPPDPNGPHQPATLSMYRNKINSLTKVDEIVKDFLYFQI